MARKPSLYAAAETALAKSLFVEAQANGTLKPGHGLIAIALSNGFRRPRNPGHDVPRLSPRRTQATGALTRRPSDTPR